MTSVIRWWVSLLFLGWIACKGDPIGQPCTSDDICGSGYDCWRNTCARLCTRDEQCGPQKRCDRHHCIEAKLAPPVTVPPPPDTLTAELRAIRRELELLHREQARLADLLQDQAPACKCKPSPAEKLPRQLP
ncbi:MAG: hypothetical protein A2341_06275 [Deltaproteobacteria bacterium RIFOXYB12_FULL_58_9]|nr:MAG: hypothetical protein A2341_06275 [Deltaproteobacteria bacterium RIFOXYB12_FULL_58_9]